MNRKHKTWLIVFALLGFFWLFFLGSNGTFTLLESPQIEGVQVLANPDFNGVHDGWEETRWRSAGGKPTTEKHEVNNGYVSMSVSGYDASFYAVALSQGWGPKIFNPDNYRNLYVSVNESCRNVVTWRGSMDSENVSLISCLGMGIDFWFDAKMSDGSIKSVEMYVFFFMDGAYALPMGTYKTVVRQDYNYTSGGMGETWDYCYFHAWQANIGEKYEHSFELYDYVSKFKHALPKYEDAEFYLARVDACMELFMGSGSFTVYYLGIEQSVR